jgi:hypothetical protein
LGRKIFNTFNPVCRPERVKWVRIVNEDLLAVPAPVEDSADLERTVAI